MDFANKTSSLSWVDFMYFKIITETSENRYSLDNYDINYFLNIFEALSLKEYISSLQMHDSVMKREQIEKASAMKKLLGG